MKDNRNYYGPQRHSCNSGGTVYVNGSLFIFEEGVCSRGMERGRVSRMLASAGDALVSVFFPGDCRLCEQLLTGANRIPICEECLASFHPLSQNICEICGQPLESFAAQSRPQQGPTLHGGPGHVCGVCQLKTYAFDRARSYALYETGLVRAIVMLKFDRIEPLGEWFAQRLLEVLRREELPDVDVVVPVPLHRQRLQERGYNQADLIGKPLARRLKLPYRPILVRKRPRPDKHILTRRERWESVNGAFATQNAGQVDNVRVLLVDDVLTTGATLNACAKALREAGAKSVTGLTVARAARRPVGDPV
jgi:ComF family protein